MLREFSAGALVVRHMQKKWWLAVIEPGREGEPEDRKDVVALPKGNVDAGEKPPETALRDRKSTRLNSSHVSESRMPSSACNKFLDNDRQLLNPAAFALPQPGTCVNFPRNAARGPNYRQIYLFNSKKPPLIHPFPPPRRSQI